MLKLEPNQAEMYQAASAAEVPCMGCAPLAIVLGKDAGGAEVWRRTPSSKQPGACSQSGSDRGSPGQAG